MQWREEYVVFRKEVKTKEIGEPGAWIHDYSLDLLITKQVQNRQSCLADSNNQELSALHTDSSLPARRV